MKCKAVTNNNKILHICYLFVSLGVKMFLQSVLCKNAKNFNYRETVDQCGVSQQIHESLTPMITLDSKNDCNLKLYCCYDKLFFHTDCH